MRTALPLLIVAVGVASACTPSRASRESAERRQANRADSVCLKFFEHLRGGQATEAYALMHGQYLSEVPLAAFSAAVRRHPLIARNTHAFVSDAGSTAALGLIDAAGDSLSFECHHLGDYDDPTRSRIITIVVAGVPVVGVGVPVPRGVEAAR